MLCRRAIIFTSGAANRTYRVGGMLAYDEKGWCSRDITKIFGWKK
jgi:hypothetical protein